MSKINVDKSALSNISLSRSSKCVVVPDVNIVSKESKYCDTYGGRGGGGGSVDDDTFGREIKDQWMVIQVEEEEEDRVWMQVQTHVEGKMEEEDGGSVTCGREERGGGGSDVDESSDTCGEEEIGSVDGLVDSCGGEVGGGGGLCGGAKDVDASTNDTDRVGS
jgi:hypothetical protein